MKSGANDILQLEDIVNSCFIALGRAMSNRDATALIHLKVDAELVKYYGDLRLLLPNTKGDNVLETLSAIRSLESTIDSMGVSTDEKRMAYWMSSAARFSLAYWLTEAGNEDSLWIAITARINGWENMPLKSAEGPPQWVIDDIESALIGAFFTANPFTAIAGAAVNSAFQELKRHGSGAGWW